MSYYREYKVLKINLAIKLLIIIATFIEIIAKLEITNAIHIVLSIIILS